MANTKITFDAQAAAGLKILVTLKQFPDGQNHRLSFGAGPETLQLPTASTYVVIADVVGAVGDTLTLTWRRASGAARPLLMNFKIDPLHVDARPWPGGKWSDRAVTGFDL